MNNNLNAVMHAVIRNIQLRVVDSLVFTHPVLLKMTTRFTTYGIILNNKINRSTFEIKTIHLFG